ncbi:hypothetical protein Leryth_017148 [Lithospermum erythrorhizon]|nr:hypothetical protein Leryth_017148 [Lithospermum erythrorhizon]
MQTVNNPNILKQAQSDIDNLILGQDYHLVNESEISKLSLIRNIIKETLRLDPAAPLLVPHRSSKECNVGGYQIPSNTILLVNAWGMHHDPTVWEDPEKFKPERFQDYYFDQLKGGNMEFDGSKFISFGSGRRACPGENVAYKVMGLALGSLIQCFDWEKVSEDKILEINKKGNVGAPKVQPLMARCYPRPNTEKLISQMKLE